MDDICINHYNFIEKHINNFYKEILKEKYIGNYEGYVDAHGDKFYSDKTDFQERNLGFGIGVMIGLLISYTKDYKNEYELNDYDFNWYWNTFDKIINDNKNIIDKYNSYWLEYTKTGIL